MRDGDSVARLVMEHLDEQALLAFTLGQLPPGALDHVQRHLDGCARCQEQQKSISSAAFSKTEVNTPQQSTRIEGSPTLATGVGFTLSRGSAVGRYVVLDKLGSGGMGEVFAAYDPQLDRKVAIKLLRSGTLSAAEGKARLLREAQAMARLQHPNVIAVHDVGVLGERVFIAMEYVEGETLMDWLRGSRRWQDIVRIFVQAGAGLGAAHQAGLVHRDFKPDNVLLGTDLRPRVVDFGLARQSTTPLPSEPGDAPSDVSLVSPLTRDGTIMGTPGYMAPEQIAGRATDARSDQFSFCVALWEGLFGTRPFAGFTLSQNAKEIAAGRLNPVPANTPVPTWVQDVLRRGLAANPADRWPDMNALRKALTPRRKSTPRRALLVGLGLVSIIGISYGAWSSQRLQVCGGFERRLTGQWDAARKAKLKAGFASTGLSFASEAWTNAERVLDAWTGDWVSASREVCEAAVLRKTDTPDVTKLKTACLDEHLLRLEALISLFDAPDHDVVNNAPSAARQLEPVSACTNTSALHQRALPDEADQASETTLRNRLAEARMLFSAGKYATGAKRLRLSLSPNAHAATQAEAYLWLAQLEFKRGETRLAHQANLLAAEQALKAGEGALEARALSRLYANEGAEETGDTDAWNRLATAAAARAPGNWEVQVELAQNEGLVDLRRKRFKAALADYERVLNLQKEHLGHEHPDVASTLNNLGVVLTYFQRPLEAVGRYEESLALHEKLEGPEHPNVATASHNLAVALHGMGNVLDAKKGFERALRVRRSALGMKHPETLRTAQALVQTHIELGELPQAKTLLSEVKETVALLGVIETPAMLAVLELETELLAVGEFWQEALEVATEHLAVARRLGPAGEKDVPLALVEQATAWTELGQWSEAKKALAAAQRLSIPTEAQEASLMECLGRLELAQGHAALAISPLERAILLQEKIKQERVKPLASARTSLMLARAFMATEQAHSAIALSTTAEQRFQEAHSTRLMLEARVLKAQATFTADPEQRAEATATLVELLPQLSEVRRLNVSAWLKKSARQRTPDSARRSD